MENKIPLWFDLILILKTIHFEEHIQGCEILNCTSAVSSSVKSKQNKTVYNLTVFDYSYCYLTHALHVFTLSLMLFLRLNCRHDKIYVVHQSYKIKSCTLLRKISFFILILCLVFLLLIIYLQFVVLIVCMDNHVMYSSRCIYNCMFVSVSYIPN